jgi:hypothetical protein
MLTKSYRRVRTCLDLAYGSIHLIYKCKQDNGYWRDSSTFDCDYWETNSWDTVQAFISKIIDTISTKTSLRPLFFLVGAKTASIQIRGKAHYEQVSPRNEVWAIIMEARYVSQETANRYERYV